MSTLVRADPPTHPRRRSTPWAARIKVLLLTADTGGGHRASAEALCEEFAHRYRDQVACLVLDPMTSPDSPRLVARVARLYGPLVQHAPWIWGLLFHVAEFRPVRRLLTAMTNRALQPRISAELARHDPDVIAVLHPLLVAPATTARRDHPTRVVSIVTDLGRPHSSWWHPDTDHVVVPIRRQARSGSEPSTTAYAREHLLGLPVRRQFTDAAALPDRDEVRRRLALARDRFVVMVSGGGEGARGTEHWARALVNGPVDVDVVVVCGRNERLRQRLARLTPPEGRRLIVTGFVDDMAAHMSAVDLLVTKAGPGVIAEAAALGLPLVVAGHLPGQESGNREHVVRTGAGIAVDSTRDLVAAVSLLRADHALLRRLRAAAKRAGRPHAAATTADMITTVAKETR